MHNQPHFQKNDRFSDNEAAQVPKKAFFRRIAQTWLRFSGPNIQSFSDSIADQELLRRSRIISALLTLIIITFILMCPTAIAVPMYWTPLSCFILLSSIAIIFNRKRQVTMSGLLFIFSIDASLIVLMLTLPNGIRNSNIPDFDLYIIPILIGGVVLPRNLIPFLAILHIGIISALFTLLPHDPLLTKEIMVNQDGLAYSELCDAFLIQIVCAMIAWLAAWSVDGALLRANRAEELAEAHRCLNEQTLRIVEQKRRLDYGIEVLREAQARFANGDYRAHANLQDNELIPLAISFNLMVERLNHVTQIAQEYTRLNKSLEQLLDIQHAIFYNHKLKPFSPTKTRVDHLYHSLTQYYQIREFVIQMGSNLEKIRLYLVAQKSDFSQLDPVMKQISSFARDNRDDMNRNKVWTMIIEKAQQIIAQAEAQGKQCLQTIMLLDQSLWEQKLPKRSPILPHQLE
jgi:hypothetical protein